MSRERVYTRSELNGGAHFGEVSQVQMLPQGTGPYFTPWLGTTNSHDRDHIQAGRR